MRSIPNIVKCWGLFLAIFWSQTFLFAQVSKEVFHLADSLAKETFEKEGLFTVLGGLKPISTVEHFQFPIDTTTKNLLSPEEASLQIQMLHESLKLLSDENIGFAIVPFKAFFGDSRSFFQIPVANSETGRFVYALPEDEGPSTTDLELKRKAGAILETYKRIREEQLALESDYPFLELLKFIRENLSECSCLREKSFKFLEPVN